MFVVYEALEEYWDKLESSMEKDRAEDMKLLKAAGCKCSISLLGYRPGWGPRCRLCNTVAKAEVPRF